MATYIRTNNLSEELRVKCTICRRRFNGELFVRIRDNQIDNFIVLPTENFYRENKGLIICLISFVLLLLLYVFGSFGLIYRYYLWPNYIKNNQEGRVCNITDITYAIHREYIANGSIETEYKITKAHGIIINNDRKEFTMNKLVSNEIVSKKNSFILMNCWVVLRHNSLKYIAKYRDSIDREFKWYAYAIYLLAIPVSLCLALMLSLQKC
jgi:hypothetical protein